MRHRALARKCFIHTLAGTFKSPSRSQSCFIVARPMVAMVKRPTHLQLATAPRDKPVKESHSHQSSVKGSWWFSLEKQTQQKTVSAVKKIKGESRRISRD